LSRYRQTLALFWIPWAAIFLISISNQMLHAPRAAFAMAFSLLAGWGLCLGPFARVPKSQYERPLEYQLARLAYLRSGQVEKAKQMEALIRQKFATPVANK
jgi:hypothetical protein